MTMAPILAVFIFFLGRYMSAGGRIKEVEIGGEQDVVRQDLWAEGRIRISWPFNTLFTR